MKIVIDIDDEKYKALTEMYETFPKEMKDWGLESIKNGTPLPEHHGRLIDADWAKNTLAIYVINEYKGQFIRRSDIDTIPTIIEGSDSE